MARSTRTGSGSVSCQDRDGCCWGTTAATSQLPALRVSEVSWIAAQTGYAASNLLWLAAAYLEDGADLMSLTRNLVSRVPGLLPGQETAMSEALLAKLAVEGPSWTLDPGRGWVNDSDYSQRNPRSKLSALKPADFAYIREFFP